MNIVVDFKNPFVLIFVIGTFLSLFLNHFLEFIDYHARVKNGNRLPSELLEIPLARETFASEKLSKIAEYENAKYFAWIPSSICTFILDFLLIVFGFYPFVLQILTNWIGIPSTIGSSFCVFSLFSIISSLPNMILSIPFDLYEEFHVEKKFGFSKMTLKLWLTDQLKSLMIGLIFGAFLIFVASVLFVKFSCSWWWILGIVLVGFTFIMQVVYPKFIAPLFNKFSPLEDGELKDKISEVLKKCGFKNDGLFVMDASKRSGHSNAYFSGFGKSKRIVLYDTLLKSMNSDELVAVLGHELGHYKLHHITKKICFLIPMEFILMFALFALAQIPSLYSGFGFSGINAENVIFFQYVGLFLASTLYDAVSEILSPIVNFSSRKDEFQADAFSKKICGTSEHLINGLIKLNAENLSEILPPKLYVIWNFSHPTLVERIKALRK